jgi:hypothetical protein
MWSTRAAPALSCRSSTFWVTIRHAPRRVGRLGLDRGAAHVVEAQHQIGIARETFGRSDVFNAVFFPKPTRRAKSVDTAFGADTGAGQDHDIAKRPHCHPLVVTLNLFQGPSCPNRRFVSGARLGAETSSA